MDVAIVGQGSVVVFAIVASLVALVVLGLMIFQTILLSRIVREVFLARIVPELRRLNEQHEMQGRQGNGLEHSVTDRVCRFDAPLLRRHDADGLAKAA